MFLEKNRERIQKDFEDFSQELPQMAEQIKKRMETLNENIVLGMKYLYSNMPYSDVGNYTFDTYLDYVQQGIYLWENSPYIREYPEEYFLNYVLFHRANDEEIKPCRTYFWSKLKDKIQGLDMEKAVLEINHWCAGEVMYQGTDMRTGSALEIYRSGVGRCGEEAVFAVNVLRSAGIPARTVYVPRWSHCDDNHAWVEVWCNGGWHYIGACEPEAVLDKGWFTNAASRAMMISSRWYDRAMPDEEVVGQDGMNRMLNQLGRYAKTKRITICVQDMEGTPVPGAKVKAEIMNYGEFSPIAQMKADEEGCISFETGFGSLLICAIFDGAYGEKVIDTREADRFVCTLGEEYEDELWVDFDMNAPEDTGRTKWDISPEQEAQNNARIAAESAHCREKIAHFQPLWKRCLFGHTMEEVLPMMDVLSEKDRRDAFPEVLEDHYQEASVYREFNPDEIYIPYVWNPRVENEVLTKWRKKILAYFDKGQRDAFEMDPKRIWEWIETNISVRNDKERLTAYTTPGAALELGIAGEKSHKVLFVAIARTLGIPSRLNPADGAVEYWDGRKFVPVLEEKRKEVRLTVYAGEETDWEYYQNWTIAVTDGNGYLTLDFTDKKWEDGKMELDIMPGDYRILTGNRLPNGNILGKRYDFHVEKGEHKKVELERRSYCLEDMLNRHSIPDAKLEKHLADGSAEVVAMSELTGKDVRSILFWLEEGREPTEHILNEILDLKEEYEKIQDRLFFILRSEEALKNPTLSKCLETLPGIQVLFHDFGKDREMTARRMYVDCEKLPLIVLTDGPCQGIFAAAGYSVGMASMLLKIYRSIG